MPPIPKLPVVEVRVHNAVCQSVTHMIGGGSVWFALEGLFDSCTRPDWVKNTHFGNNGYGTLVAELLTPVDDECYLAFQPWAVPRSLFPNLKKS
jgi:hypothetical protein